MDDISNISDMKRLYQLYVMTDKILSMQMISSGINYEMLKKFKMLSLRINYLNMQDASLEMNNLSYDTKDFYDEQKRILNIVRIMEDAIKIRSMLITNYRKYSALPLVLEDDIELDNFDYYSDKLNNLNDYVQNEVYLSKLNDSLSSLGIELGNKINQEEEILKSIPVYEEKLKSNLCSNSDIKKTLLNYDLNLDEIMDNEEKMLSIYNDISSNYEEVIDKYEAMKLVNDGNYMDVMNEITNEYNTLSKKRNIIEIIKLVLDETNEYDKFIEKMNNISTSLLRIDQKIFGTYFENLVNSQLENISKVDTIRKELDDIRDNIYKDNSLISRINNQQLQLKDKILMDKDAYYNQNLDNQVIDIVNSYIPYSKERTDNVLKFVLNELNKNTAKIEQEKVIEDNKEIREYVNNTDDDNLFENISDTSSLFEDSENHLDDDLFTEKLDSNDIFDDENDNSQYFDKVESYDDIFKNQENDLFNLEKNIFNDKIDAQVGKPKVQYLDANNNFWPNMW